MRKLLAVLIVLTLSLIGCTKSNPTAPPVDTYVVPFSILGVSFSTPEVNLHDTSFAFTVRWALRGVPDSIQYQTEFLGRLVNDTMTYYLHPYAYTQDSVEITARADYWVKGVEYWYNYTETVAVVKINRP
jgi:hypothetical protein